MTWTGIIWLRRTVLVQT